MPQLMTSMKHFYEIFHTFSLAETISKVIHLTSQLRLR